MANYTKEQMIDAVDSFPDALRHLFFSPDTEEKVQKIGMSAGLLIDQLKTLNSIANDAIIGLLAEKDLEMEIKNSFAFSELRAKEIAKKILTEILKPTNELREKVLAEQKQREEKERLEAIEEENEKRAEAEETEVLLSEYSSEAPSEIHAPEQALLLGKAPDIEPKNLPVKKETESFLPKLIPKIPTTESEPIHPFEEKMKTVFTSTSAETGNIALVPLEKITTIAPILPEQNSGEQAPQAQTNTPRATPVPSTGNLRHDPYREAIE